jgi:hypothetical protein
MSLRVPSKATPLSRFPLRSSYIEKDVPFPEPSFTYLYKSPAKEPPFQVPLAELPQRDAPSPELSFTCLSKSPVKESLLQVPPGGPLWSEMSISRAIYYISVKVPSKGAPSSSPSQSPHRERRSLSLFFYLSLRVPGLHVADGECLHMAEKKERVLKITRKNSNTSISKRQATF